MSKLNQIIAVEKGKKERFSRSITEVYKVLDKGQLLSGLSRTWKAKEEDGEVFPNEVALPQIKTSEIIDAVVKEAIDLYDLTLTKEFGNTKSFGSIKIDGNDFGSYPVTFLLFLEKRFTDLRTFVNKIPVLDPTRTWDFDQNKDTFVSDKVSTLKTKTISKPIVLYDATPDHPAQTQMIQENVVVGTWETQHFSSALPAVEKQEILTRIEKMIDAVKAAREEANSIDVEQHHVGEKLLNYVFDLD